MNLFYLVVKTGEFGQDIVLPAVVGTVVGLIILQQLLNRWGYALW